MELSQILEKQKIPIKRRRIARETRPSKRTEVWYRDQLVGFVKRLEQLAIEELKQERLADDINVVEKIKRSKLWNKLAEKFASLSAAPLSIKIARGMVNRGDEQNKSTIQRSLKESLGIDVTGMLGGKGVTDAIELALQENIGLIKSIQTDFINEIGDVVRASVMEGKRHEDMIALIKERGEVAESRARLIARDQTAKFNTALTKVRHESLGIHMYVWGSSGDERTRDTHKTMRGLLCRYDDPTVYSTDEGKTWKKRTSKMVHLHPGEDYQCRCFARPYIKIN